ncbi:hypothetical protein XENOCAPTIV_001882, partial [Xenoophorus captivus]
TRFILLKDPAPVSDLRSLFILYTCYSNGKRSSKGSVDGVKSHLVGVWPFHRSWNGSGPDC